MAQKSDRSAARAGTKGRWRPPVWLLVLDTVSLLVLALGLLMQFAPGSGIARALPAEAKLPLLALGGAFFVFCWFALIRSLLSAHRGG